MNALLRSVARGLLPARVHGPIRARRVRRLISEFTPRDVEHVYAGFALSVRLEDPLAEGWYDHDWAEPPEITALRRGRLRAGARVFDLGAHQGVVALMLARVVGAAGQVIAVEAEPHNVAVARRNAAANDAANLTVLHAAAAAASGVLSFAEGLNGTVAVQGRPGAVEVPSLTVDELASRYGRPDVVLVDVEGYEAHVLEGARATLAAGATDFFVELHAAPALAAVGRTADDVVAHFVDGPFDLIMADAPQDSETATVWQDAGSMIHRSGRRCFLVARPRSAR